LENRYYYSKYITNDSNPNRPYPPPPPSFLYSADEIGRTQIPSLIDSIQKEAQQTDSGAEMLVRANLINLYVWLLRRWNKKSDLTTSRWYYYAYKRLVAVFQYIQENFTEDISTADMAGILVMSVPHFCRSFKKIAGCSFHNYLRSFRVSEATKYLLSTDLNITQIASMVGYEDVNFFIRVFKKQTGMSPMRYRKKWEAENAPLILQP
jgi:YesN/AraC family two-component response regulator